MTVKLVFQLLYELYFKSENDKLNRQYQLKLEEEKATSSTTQQAANYDFKTKFIENKNYAKVSHLIK